MSDVEQNTPVSISSARAYRSARLPNKIYGGGTGGGSRKGDNERGRRKGKLYEGIGGCSLFYELLNTPLSTFATLLFKKSATY